MFNNYAIVQGVDHIIPVDVYLPGCPPRPEMLLNAIITLHEQIQNTPLGVNRVKAARAAEEAALEGDADARDEGAAARERARTTRTSRAPGAATPDATAEQEVAPRRRRSRRRRTAADARRPPGGPGTPEPVVGVAARHVRRRDDRRHHRLRRPGAARSLFPGAAVRPYGGYFDEVADPLERGAGRAAPPALRPRRSSGSSSTAAR